MNPRLVAVSGPLKGSTISVEDGELTVGRQPGNRICIDDELMSRRHCVLWRQETGVEIREHTFERNLLRHGNDRTHVRKVVMLGMELSSAMRQIS